MTGASSVRGAARARWHQWRSDPARASDGWILAAVGLALRVALAVWASGRVPPAADGKFYHVVADRIAQGHGYTWLWPDGAVTYAAHYPVGYPALIGAAYLPFGAHSVVAMLLNALLGALGVVAVHRICATVAGRAGAALAALLVALHPTLLGYTPALMTEGVVAALLGTVAWLTLVAQQASGRRRWGTWLGMALLLGVTTLVRPQSLLLAPLFGWVAAAGGTAKAPGAGWRRSVVGAILTTAVVVATCTPWTVRNCSRMGRCLFVSANAGWNLLIGAGPGATGKWVSIEDAGLPPECRTVFDEAEKDLCFGRAAIRHVRAEPGRWLRLIPTKLRTTFDASGTPGYYFAEANPAAVSQATRDTLAAVETVWQRVIVALALLAVSLASGARRRARRIVGALSAVGLVLPQVWVSYLGVAVGAALLGRGLGRHPPALFAAAGVAVTALTHVVFFGAGRYSMVCYPLLAALAGAALTRPREGPDRLGADRARGRHP